MRILIDFTQIPTARTGVGIYAENLVRELGPLLDPRDHLFVLVQRDELGVRALVADNPRVSLLTLPSVWFRNRLLLLAFEQLILPLVLLRRRIDVLHSLHYTHPVVSFCPRAVTIHDLTFFKFPQLHTFARRLLFPFFIKRAMRHAEAVLFVSNATARDAERLAPGSRHLRRVTPLGVDREDFVTDPQEVLASLREKAIGQPYLLSLGTIEPRKNLVRLLAAFARIAPEFPEFLLVIAGHLGWAYQPVLDAIASSPVRERIIRLGYISEQDKRTLLAGCSALVYPSLYEGFGLPVLEAMAAGAPVITSNVSSLPEVAGTAAILINPESVEDLAAAMRRLLSEPGLVEQCRQSGLQRAGTFTWARTARETYEAYREVCATQSEERQGSSLYPSH